jgi:hypothetical protein
MLDRTTQPSFGDDGQARYQKMCRVVREYNLIQVGVALFHREGDGSLVARPFNFYVFPPAKSARGRLVMHSSTAEFHNTNHLVTPPARPALPQPAPPAPQSPISL